MISDRSHAGRQDSPDTKAAWDLTSPEMRRYLFTLSIQCCFGSVTSSAAAAGVSEHPTMQSQEPMGNLRAMFCFENLDYLGK